MLEQHLTNNLNPNQKNIAILKQHFGQCFAKDGSFDFDKFKQELTDNEIDLFKESYSLDWLGKSYARILATDKATTLLSEDTEHNQQPENSQSQNLLLKGDNLEILKHLSHAYYEKVKMIYIDPPYNTGSDGFVYQDDKKFTIEQLQQLTGMSKEKSQRILSFTQSNSNSHSAWLTFMYPRLYIARQLLRDDGVIFISIDDNEVAQLRLLMDDLFGEENFVAEFARITKKAGKTTELVAKNTDYLLWYAKGDAINLKGINFTDDKYNNRDEYFAERGYYKLSQTLDYSSIQYSASLDYEIELAGKTYRAGNVSKAEMQARQQANPNSDFCWRWSKKRFDFGLKHGFIVVKNGRIYTKTYQKMTIDKANKEDYQLVPITRTKPISTLEFTDNQYSNDNAKKHLAHYFTDKVFEYPKPTSLIKKLAEIATSDSDIILDFFAGSGTTADAVMQLNSEDGGKRQFILVQLAETIDPKKNKTAYELVKNELGITEPTIFDITKERIIRSHKKIHSDNANAKPPKDLSKQDMGFKIFTTMEKTSPIWTHYPFQAEKFSVNLKLFDEQQLSNKDIHALLTTWKTYDGYFLTQAITPYALKDYTAYLAQSDSSQTLYLMDKDFDTAHLLILINCLDDDKDFNPTTLIAFGYHFDSKALLELSESFKNLSNKDSANTNLGNKKQIAVDFVVRY